MLEPHAVLNKTRRCLIGAYFLNEYSFEASALFNPSIVRHPDQTGAPDNGCQFILEPSRRRRRAYFIADVPVRHHAADGRVAVDPTARLASVPKVQSRTTGSNGDNVEVNFGRARNQQNGSSFRSPTSRQTASRTPDLSNSTRMDEKHSTQLTPPIAAGRSARSCGDDGFPIVPDDTARRIGGAQQGHGAVPAENRWPLCDDRAAGQREPLLIYSDDPTHGMAVNPSFSPSILGNSFRSAIVAPPSSWTTAGCC